MTSPPHVQLTLLNRADNVMLVRQVLRGIAPAIRLDAARLDDVLTAVSEASNNVVLHAYRGGAGPLEVEVRARPARLGVVVRDRGCGIKPRSWNDDEPVRGIGLASIQTFTDSAEFRGSPNRGTEIRMEFEAPDLLGLDDSIEPVPPAPPPEDLDASIHLSVTPPRLLTAILECLVPALAARADFPIDRLADARLLFQQVASFVAASADPRDRLSCLLVSDAGRLGMRVWPLTPTVADQLASGAKVAGANPVIARLADAHHVERGGRNRQLSLSLSDGGG